MLVHTNVANGYRDTKIKKIKEDNPGISEVDAVREFVEETYCSWIDRNMENAVGHYEVANVTENSFQIDFTFADDADEFRTKVGGRVVES